MAKVTYCQGFTTTLYFENVHKTCFLKHVSIKLASIHFNTNQLDRNKSLFSLNAVPTSRTEKCMN